MIAQGQETRRKETKAKSDNKINKINITNFLTQNNYTKKKKIMRITDLRLLGLGQQTLTQIGAAHGNPRNNFLTQKQSNLAYHAHPTGSVHLLLLGTVLASLPAGYIHRHLPLLRLIQLRLMR